MPWSTIHKRRRQFRRVTWETGQLLLNVRNFFEKEAERGRKIHARDLTKRLMQATKFGRNTVSSYTTQSDVDKLKNLSQPERRERISKISTEFVPLIRHSIRYMLTDAKIMPTLDNIMQFLHDTTMNDEETNTLQWTYCRTTLYRFMKSNGFVFTKTPNHYEYTREREDIICMRDNYLFWVDKYRKEGYNIYYQDETWMNKNMAPNKIWKYGEDGTVHYQVPSGKGERCIISHVGSATTGLLSGCLLLMRGQKGNKDKDYHKEMNGEVFCDWLKRKVFPAIMQRHLKSVLVLDRATYHTMLTPETRPPRRGWRKQQLVDAIQQWGGPDHNGPADWTNSRTVTKSLLYAHAVRICPQPQYQIQAIADSFSTDTFHIKILFLPVAHPELSPIEMVWSDIKRHLCRSNFSFKLEHFEEIARESMREFGPISFNKYCTQVYKEEEKYIAMSTAYEISAPVGAITTTESSSSASNQGSNENSDRT